MGARAAIPACPGLGEGCKADHRRGAREMVFEFHAGVGDPEKLPALQGAQEPGLDGSDQEV
jgi:hypothetical protein